MNAPLPNRRSPSGPDAGFGVGDWIAFAASYSTVGLDGVQGDGTCTAQYRYEGNAIRVQTLMVVGTTTVIGASAQNVPLPPGIVIDPLKTVFASVVPGVGLYPTTVQSTNPAFNGGANPTLSIGPVVLNQANISFAWAVGEGWLFDVLFPLVS